MFREVDTKAYGTLAFDPNSPSMYLKAGLSYSMRGTTHTSNRVLAYSQTAHQRCRCTSILHTERCVLEAVSMDEPTSRASGYSASRAISETNKKPTGDLEWHLDLKEYTFGLAILQEVNSLLDRIEGNWKEVTTVRTLVSIVSRLLASSPDAEVTTGCIEFLLKARQVTWSWLKQLEEKLQEAGEEFVRSFQDKVCEMAAVCRSTFDVDDVDENGNGRGYLPQLFVTAEDVSIYVCCGIRVHDNTPTDLEATKSRVSPSFKRLIRPAAGNQNMGRQGLDQALSYIWAAYRSGRQQWNVMSGSNKRWVRCLAATEGAASQTLVNLDLVRCRLLVNGKPLGRLPPQITKHVLYMRIFGSQKVLDVIPSQFRGMEFETRTLICGYQVYFGMRDEKELVIRVSKDGQILELIPHEEFRGDLPIHLVEDHTHWLDLANGEVEIRPLSDVWESKDNNWVIHSQQAPRVCVNSTRTMIDVNSRTFQMIAATLEPFEQAEYLTVTCARNKDPTTISVDLPRYRLSFFRNENEALESRNFPGMVIDHDDQSIGALFGLRTRLVLRPDDPNLAGGRRRILIPYGKIDLPQYQSDHVEIYIDTKDARFIKFADYVVDTDQGCLTGNTSLKSRLYLVYLLALTSHCLPDPLSKQTGTEEALSELSSAACMSFRELGEEEIVLLLQIGKLSPNRFGAPQFSPKVQSITWNTLPSLSQHDGFALRARQILDCAELQKVFAEQKSDEKEENDAKKDALPKRNQTLDTRAATRAAVYYPAGIANRMLDPANDQKYTSRDESLLNETLVWSVATSVLGGGTSLALPRQTSLPLLFKRWEKVRAPSGNFKLSFSRSWMFAKMQEAWLSVYTLCTARGTSQEKRQYQLLFSLAAMLLCSIDSSFVTGHEPITSTQPLKPVDIPSTFNRGLNRIEQLSGNALMTQPFLCMPPHPGAFQLTRMSQTMSMYAGADPIIRPKPNATAYVYSTTSLVGGLGGPMGKVIFPSRQASSGPTSLSIPFLQRLPIISKSATRIASS
ncbi:hypothetical protein VNI00_015172 [Paramarasmius palmivorus]|uniref:Uncharacterized protein n=1 Tax=Paramarasmius palmivorus TaxID=297713 RepID=A0AAW0BLN6_9AGAR